MLGTQEELALLGGPAVVGEGAVQPWPQVAAADKAAVMGVLERGVLWGAAAPEATALQEEWAAYVGARHCLVTNSGTAALHMAVAAAGVQPGDEVITTPMSWSSTATSILHHNAIPVFADIDPETYTLDPKQIEAKITPRTRAISAGAPLRPARRHGRHHGGGGEARSEGDRGLLPGAGGDVQWALGGHPRSHRRV